MTSEDETPARLAQLELTVAHQRELMEYRDKEMERRLDDLKMGITSIRALIIRGLSWGAGGLLAAVCSLIWQRLGP